MVHDKLNLKIFTIFRMILRFTIYETPIINYLELIEIY
jgi:hypothetical protein